MTKIILKRVDALKIARTSAFLVILLVTLKVEAQGVGGGDNELLVSIASLARRGAQAICDIEKLQLELDLEFGEVKQSTKRLGDGGSIERLESFDIFSKSGVELIRAEYSRDRSLHGDSCRLSMYFKNHRLCTQSKSKIDVLMGAISELGPYPLHDPMTTYSYVYKYQTPISQSEVFLNRTNNGCVYGISLTSKGK